MHAWEVTKVLSIKHKLDFYITEVKNGPTQYGEHLRMDAVAIKKSWTNPCISIYEVKVSRGDFKQDEKWHLYRQYGNTFSFAVPEGLISKEELPEGVGLYYIKANGSIRTIVKPKFYDVKPDAAFLLYIMMNRLDNERIPFFSDEFELYNEYLESKKLKKKIGFELACKLNDSIRNHERNVEKFNKSKEDSDETISCLEELADEIKKYGFRINTWSDSLMIEGLTRILRNSKEEVEKAIESRIKDVEELKKSCTNILKLLKEEEHG